MTQLHSSINPMKRPISQLCKSGLRYAVRDMKSRLGHATIYDSYWKMEALLWWNSKRRKHYAIAHPFKTIEVDPTDIERVTERGPYPGKYQWQDIGKVISGSWDIEGQLFADLPRVQVIKERFEMNKSWEDIYIKKNFWSGIKPGSPEKNLKRWYSRVDRLYESIRESGYSRERLDPKIQIENRSLIHRDKNEQIILYDDIVVDIGRDGQLLFVNGRHRLAISQILGINAIPVRVIARHTDWQRIREEHDHATNQNSMGQSQYADHPDLEDIQ